MFTLLILAIVLAQTHVIATSQPAGSSEFTTVVEATRVYGLYHVKLPDWMVYHKAVMRDGKVLLAGDGYVAEVSLDNLTLDWSHSILGKATALTLDSIPARFVAVGTSMGEVSVIDLEYPSLRMVFYVASRAPVMDAYVTRVSGGTRLLVLDELGYLYVVRMIAGYLGGGWFEVGPIKHRGALTGLYDLKVGIVRPLAILGVNGSYKLVGDKVAALTDLVLPTTGTRSQFLGSLILSIYYVEDGLVTPAYIGAFNVSPSLVEYRSIYYTIRQGRYLIPLGNPSLEANMQKAGEQPLTIHGIPPGDYEVLVFYEVKLVERTTSRIVSSRCYAASTQVHVKPGATLSSSITLEERGVTLGDCVKYFNLDAYYTPKAMQVLLLLNLTRLPEVFEYGVDGDMVLLPIPNEVIGGGVRSLLESQQVLFIKPGHGTPWGWSDLGIDSIILVAIGEWLLVYYLGDGLKLADVGYMQPQTIYFGNRITALHVSPDASRIYVGLDSGALFMLRWLTERQLLAQPSLVTGRYYIDSSLEIGGGAITSVQELGDRVTVMVSTDQGRLQLVSIGLRGLTPLWRGPPGFEGVDTGLPNTIFTVSSSTITAYSPGSSKLYILKGNLVELQILLVNLIPVSFRDDGSWFISSPPGDVEVVIVDSGGAPLALDKLSGGRALLYVPTGYYKLVIRSSWGVASTLVHVSPGFNEITLALVQEPIGGVYLERLTAGITIDDIIKRKPPRVNVEIRLVDVDGNPVTGRFKVTLEGPSYSKVTMVSGDIVRFEGVPLGSYRVTITPLEGFYNTTSTLIRVTMRGVEPNVVELKPLYVTITLKIIDRQFKTTVSEPFLVKLERLEAGSGKLVYTREVRVQGQVKLQLPIGTYKATLVPAGRDLYQIPRETRFMVTGGGDISIELQPKTFTLTIKVVDIWGSPLPGARVSVVRVDGKLALDGESGEDGSLSLAIPAGSYEVRVERRWFKGATVLVDVTGDTSEVVRVEPGLVAYLTRYSPYIAGLLGIAVVTVVVLWARRVVGERLREEYF